MQALQYAIEGLFEVLLQRIAKDIFEASVGLTAVVVLSPAGGEAEAVPIGCLVAGPLKSSLRIDEGLQPDDRIGSRDAPNPEISSSPSAPKDMRPHEGLLPRAG